MLISNSEIIVKASLWADAAKSWKLLTRRSLNGKGWSGGDWFPKSVCTLEESRHERGVYILTLPLWLYQKKSEAGVDFTNLQNEII